jgi:amphi-Trp domain-containing protein
VGKKEISYKGRVEPGLVVTYLEELLKGLRAGTLYVQSGDDYVSLKPTKIVDIEVEAVEKKEKAKFTLELSWETEPAGAEQAELKILSTEPKIARVPTAEERQASGN